MVNEINIPLKDWKKIIKIACSTWKNKLERFGKEHFNFDTETVEVCKNMQKDMLDACTEEQRLTVARIFDDCLRRKDPYEKFKNALKEGKIVQYYNEADQRWWSEGEWSLGVVGIWCGLPPTHYRIKHKHQDCIDAYAAGKKIEYRHPSMSDWQPAITPNWNEETEYRVAPEVIQPFTFKDAENLVGKVIKHVLTDSVYLIVGAGIEGVITMYSVGWSDLCNNFTFLDGTPCGKKINN